MIIELAMLFSQLYLAQVFYDLIYEQTPETQRGGTLMNVIGRWWLKG